MIEVESLRKEYGALVAVHDVSFTVRPGTIFGLLGPNGAGKSTTISCICGLLRPTAGRIRILGHDVVSEGPASRRELGVVPQELALYEDLSAAENLRYWGAAQGLRGAALAAAVGDVLGRIGLADRADEPVTRFSGGMKRRLNFGCALVHTPRVLLLDEPTVGVDPQSRERLLELVRAQAAAGSAVLYTTHYMEEAQALCTELAIIDHGRVLERGTLDELRARAGERGVLRFSGEFDPQRVREALGDIGQASELELLQCEPGLVAISMPEASRRLPEVLAALTAAGATVRETTLAQASLESLFLGLTGRALRE